VPAATTATAGTARPDVLDLSPELAARIPPIQVAMWRDAARRVGNCAHPVRLRGQVHQVDRATGELREVYATDREPDGLLRKPCGNRRASVCPACAEVYRQDAYQLLRAGLAGGKGVPESVAEHPALFVTFTAPSFGPVHRHHTTPTGRLLPCQVRRRAEVCPHGVRLECRRVHPAGDPRVGEPLCSRCYDYTRHVLFNALAPELWRRTTINLPRALAHAAGLTHAELRRRVRVRFAKVAEYQTRGAIHYHAIIRLDACPPADHPDQITPPPAPFDVELLEYALRAAAGKAKLHIPNPDDPTRGLLLRWGDQLDTRPITTSSQATLSAEQVAGYIAKYVTKSTEILGLTLQRRLTDRAVDYLSHQGLRPHVVRLVQTTWTLGGHPHLAHLKLRGWAHQLGFGGHWSTRSRRYSTTMTALRRARAEHTRRARWPNRLPLDAWGRLETDQAVEVLATWSYAGSGWRTQVERQLAVAAAVRAREHRRLARRQRATA